MFRWSGAPCGVFSSMNRDLAQAEVMYKKSVALFQEVGAAAEVQKVQGWLAALAVPRASISNRSRKSGQNPHPQ
jgi:hypothetical protein